MRTRCFGAAAVLVVTVFSPPGHADVSGVSPATGSGDGVYGRFDGDVDWGLGVGIRSGAPGVGPNARLSAHFLSTVGLTVEATWPLLYERKWSLATAVDLRPLFLPRWALDLEQGPAFLDLMLDSISVSGGPVFHPLDPVGVGFGVEAGFGIPLSSHAQGWWLHVRGSSRWVDDRPPLGGVVLLSWQTPWLSPALR